MARVLSAISRDSPAATLDASVNDTFSFTGTPTLSGGGGVQRYDFRWEIDQGAGYVPITGSTNLTTADTNPLVNTNSQSANSITVACAQAGTYTIRMAGAPTSGGSYTVFSPTASVTVSMAAITGTMAAVETGADTFVAAGTVAVSGALAASESGADVFAGAGAVAVSGTLSAAETGADTFAGSGTVGSTEITGTMAATESGADTFAASGGVLVTGVFAAAETGGDTFAGAGAVAVSGAFAVQEAANDNFNGTGTVAITGTMVAVETGADVFRATSESNTCRLMPVHMGVALA